MHYSQLAAGRVRSTTTRRNGQLTRVTGSE
jgi:hypothetical protein